MRPVRPIELEMHVSGQWRLEMKPQMKLLALVAMQRLCYYVSLIAAISPGAEHRWIATIASAEDTLGQIRLLFSSNSPSFATGFPVSSCCVFLAWMPVHSLCQQLCYLVTTCLAMAETRCEGDLCSTSCCPSV
jgi:hypothetical protein